MQIVIKIPNEEVPNNQEIIDINLHFIDGEVCECSYPYIVLPKGHGRLIDADALNRKDVNCANVPMNFIDTAPTIIKADKEEEDNG